MQVTFFKTPAQFRTWLRKNHKKEKELFVGFYKVGTGKPSMVWSQAVDQALCFGWIDGVRKSIDSESYCNRFTPRRPTSIWSAINIKKVEELTRLKLMTPAGQSAFNFRSESRMNVYSSEREAVDLSPKYKRQFRLNKKAWNFFKEQAPSYKKVMIHWIMTAKQEKTRASRLEKAIKISEALKRMI